MEQLFAVEIWMALIGVSCITGWLIGDWNGSERMRRLMDGDVSVGHSGWEPLRKAEKLGKDAALLHWAGETGSDGLASQDTLIGIANGDSAQTPDSAVSRNRIAKATSEARCERENTACLDWVDGLDLCLSDALSPLANLHAQVEAIRRSGRVWDSAETGLDYAHIDPHSAKILTNYKSSIEALQELDDRDVQDQSKLELPRFADAAPVSPFFSRTGVTITSDPYATLQDGPQREQAFTAAD